VGAWERSSRQHHGDHLKGTSFEFIILRNAAPRDDAKALQPDHSDRTTSPASLPARVPPSTLMMRAAATRRCGKACSTPILPETDLAATSGAAARSSPNSSPARPFLSRGRPRRVR